MFLNHDNVRFTVVILTGRTTKTRGFGIIMIRGEAEYISLLHVPRSDGYSIN